VQAGGATLLPLAPGKRIYTMGMGQANVEKYG
jgi:beta-glucosidase